MFNHRRVLCSRYISSVDKALCVRFLSKGKVLYVACKPKFFRPTESSALGF